LKFKIPRNQETERVLADYGKRNYEFFYNQKVGKTRLSSIVNQWFKTNFDMIAFDQVGTTVSRLAAGMTATNDLGVKSFVVLPFRLKSSKAAINNLLGPLKEEFRDIKECTFQLLPDQRELGEVLLQLGFRHDATMLIGEVKASLAYYKSLESETDADYRLKKFRFSRDYPLLKRIFLVDAKRGAGDSRLNFSNRTYRAIHQKIWKDASSRKETADAFGLWDGKKLVGAVAVNQNILDKNIKAIVVSDIMIDVAYRGKKLSRLLYEAAFEWAIEQDIRYYLGATTTAAVLNAAPKLQRRPYLIYYSKALE
jgi:hypothetical protein